MSMFTKSKLVVALASAGCALAAGQAGAVYVNDGGLGQALIYPYYTVRGDNVTLVSVVNTTDQAKVVKVRFREGKNSSDVLDFNLFLSREDVWTGVVVSAPDGGAGTGGARLISRDTSCVNPTSDEDGNTFATGIPFRTFDFPAPSSLYAGGLGETTSPDLNDEEGANASSPASVNRVREGYIEIIEIAMIPNGNDLGKDVTHGAGSATAARTPPCKIVPGLTTATAAKFLAPPTGGLFGNVSHINVPIGSANSVDATALADFWPQGLTNGYTDAANDQPNLGSGTNRSVVVEGENVFITEWADRLTPAGEILTGGFLATTAVLMRDSLYAEYSYTNDKVFSTDIVVTMPNKRYFVNNSYTGSSINPALQPFENPYRMASGSCDTIAVASYDREEGTAITRTGFSPVRPGTRADQLCWESNVIGVGIATDAAEPSRVLGSTNNLWYRGYQNNGQPVPSVGAAPQGEGGWLRLTFARPSGAITTNTAHALLSTIVDSNTVVSPSGVTAPTNITYQGLPVVGFVTTNGNQGTRASFGTSAGLRYSRLINRSGTVQF